MLKSQIIKKNRIRPITVFSVILTVIAQPFLLSIDIPIANAATTIKKGYSEKWCKAMHGSWDNDSTNCHIDNESGNNTPSSCLMSGYMLDGKGRCVMICENGHILNADGNGCACPNGEMFNTTTGQCSSGTSNSTVDTDSKPTPTLNEAMGTRPAFGKNPNDNQAEIYNKTVPYSHCPQPKTNMTVSSGVYVLGDSITHQAREEYKKAFSDTDFSINAHVGRDIAQPGNPDTPENGDKRSTGLEAIDTDKEKVSKAGSIVVALGSNGGTNNGTINQLIDKIRSLNKDAKIYWVDTYSSSSSYIETIQKANKAIYEQSENSQKYTVLSWAKTVSPSVSPHNLENTEGQDTNFYISKDGLHLSTDGVTALVGLVKSEVFVKTKSVSSNPESLSESSATAQGIGPEIEVGASIFGGSWDGKEAKRNPSDDNGEGALGPHKGHTMFAELSSPGTKDFSYLAQLLNPPKEYTGWGKYGGFKAGTKFKVTYKGRSIIMEKRDVGGGGGPVNGKARAIDIWYETAKLLDFREGLAVMKIQQVSSSTPVTALDGSPEEAGKSAEAEVIDPCCKVINASPSDTNSMMGELSGAGVFPVPEGRSTGEQTYKFLLERGLSKNQAAGIIGNLMQESGGGTLNLKTATLGDGGTSLGIAQWHKGRKAKLESYAASIGKAATDLVAQANYLWKELNTGYRHVLNGITASKTIEGASEFFVRKYEIPANIEKRVVERAAMSKKAAMQLEGASESTNAMMADSSPEKAAACSANNSVADPGAFVDASGYAFPLANYKPTNGNLTCSPKKCHHDGSAAFDLMSKGGTSTYALIDGTITLKKHYDGFSGKRVSDPNCHSIMLTGKDGWQYWYGHTYAPDIKQGQQLKAGERMGQVGSSECGLGSPGGSNNHLHIDRGSPKGRGGGSPSHRDDGFAPLLQQVMRNMKSGNSVKQQGGSDAL